MLLPLPLHCIIQRIWAYIEFPLEISKMFLGKDVTKIGYDNLKSDSHLSQKNCIICFIESPLKMMKNAFYFILKTLFVLKILKILSWLFGHVGKTAWLGADGYLQNAGRHSLVNKQLQYKYWPISHEVEATRQWNLVN